MFPYINRVHTGDFKTIFRGQKRYQTEHFRIIYIKSSTFKCSIVVSKKIIKKASKRNLSKRKLAPIIKDVFNTKSDLWLICYIIKDIGSQSRDLIEKELNEIKNSL